VDAATSYTFERRVLGSSTSTSVTTAALAYAPTATLAGGSWQWRVTALDAAGQTMAASGWRDFTVVDHPVADTDVSITGSGAVGTDLTVNPPAWNLPGVTTTYQWKRNGTSISGATGLLYTVTTTDVGKNLTVVATGTKDGYQAGTSTSNTIVGSAGAAPTPSVAPSISGSRQVGQVLTADHGVWPGSPKYTYQWQRNGHAITGATAATYRTQAADATTSISVRVTATSTGLLPGSATSNALTIAKNPSTTSAGLVSSTVTKGRHGKLNVVVAVPGVPKPTGTLKVFSGTTLLTTVSLRVKNAGHKAITLPLLPVGSHKIRVKYSGSSTIAKSKSSPVVLSVVK
jgi:large repetitive protein